MTVATIALRAPRPTQIHEVSPAAPRRRARPHPSTSAARVRRAMGKWMTMGCMRPKRTHGQFGAVSAAASSSIINTLSRSERGKLRIRGDVAEEAQVAGGLELRGGLLPDEEGEDHRVVLG